MATSNVHFFGAVVGLIATISKFNLADCDGGSRTCLLRLVRQLCIDWKSALIPHWIPQKLTPSAKPKQSANIIGCIWAMRFNGSGFR